jgi:DNA-binding Lrp family transcriptional regulator
MGKTDLTYQQSTQTLIGQQKKTLQDMDTGEIIQVDQITKRVYGTKQFWKVYLMDFLTVLGIIDSKQLDVFVYIAQNTNPTENVFIGTYDDISKAVNVSRPTIAKIMHKLQKNNFIRLRHRGVWYVNPNILMKGNDTRRQILLSYYESQEPAEETVTISRGNRERITETKTQTPAIEGQIGMAEIIARQEELNLE